MIVGVNLILYLPVIHSVWPPNSALTIVIVVKILIIIVKQQYANFWVVFSLCYKVSRCKTMCMKMSSVYMLIFMQIKLIFMRKVFKDLFWNRGTRLLGNSILLLTWLHLVTISHISFILYQSIVLVNRTWKYNYVLITHQLRHLLPMHSLQFRIVVLGKRHFNQTGNIHTLPTILLT